jgi:hypothetical protein
VKQTLANRRARVKRRPARADARFRTGTALEQQKKSVKTIERIVLTL